LIVEQVANLTAIVEQVANLTAIVEQVANLTAIVEQVANLLRIKVTCSAKRRLASCPTTLTRDFAMDPSPELIDAMYKERVEAARATSGEEKLLAGPRLFELVCRIMADGIRGQYPDADEATVQAILRERLELSRRLEQTQ
jgi:hypothetical protein